LCKHPHGRGVNGEETAVRHLLKRVENASDDQWKGEFEKNLSCTNRSAFSFFCPRLFCSVRVGSTFFVCTRTVCHQNDTPSMPTRSSPFASDPTDKANARHRSTAALFARDMLIRIHVATSQRRDMPSAHAVGSCRRLMRQGHGVSLHDQHFYHHQITTSGSIFARGSTSARR